LALPATFALECLLERRLLAPMLLGALPFLALVGSGNPVPACRSATAATFGDYDLCYQFFHDRYHPDSVAQAWRLLNDPSLPLVSDYEGFYSLRVLGIPGMQVQQYQSFSGARPPAIVVARPGDLERIAGTLGLDPRGYRLLADTGYFKLYVIPPR
jgi:hypothetical protein